MVERKILKKTGDGKFSCYLNLTYRNFRFQFRFKRLRSRGTKKEVRCCWEDKTSDFSSPFLSLFICSHHMTLSILSRSEANSLVTVARKNCLLTGRNLEQNRTQHWAAICLDSQHCWVSFRNNDPIPSHHSARLHHVHASGQAVQHVFIVDG